MRALSYKFECIYKKHGICTKTGTAGCELDCNKLNCDFCIHTKTDRKKNPCVECFIKEDKI